MKNTFTTSSGKMAVFGVEHDVSCMITERAIGSQEFEKLDGTEKVVIHFDAGYQLTEGIPQQTKMRIVIK